MFSSSSQLKHWTFNGEAELIQLRNTANRKFIEKHGCEMSEEERQRHFLSAKEERILLRRYEMVMREFCNRFQPPMPKYVLGTSLAYFKRFYINNSVMDYHPKEIMLTSVYLACKVEEFNVSIMQYVGNLKGNREKFADIILGFELQLMKMLNYHLTIHNPFRPLEGLLLDVKTRCRDVEDPERLRRQADEFIDRSLSTDTCLIFAPSQIALAALLTSATREGANIEGYVTGTLLAGPKEQLLKTVQQVKRIKYMVKNQASSQKDQDLVKSLEKKLERCRNQENNPESDIYKQKLEEMFENEEEERSKKRMKLERERKRAEEELVNT
ncbi:cyclin-H-like [Liolophura sinensis]|uniref:cyclin-H-like n=1 Tax=Liolophura sinensis TaxID=3198878 RepID=UPI0031587CA9